MTERRDSEQLKQSLGALATRARVSDELVDRLISNARAQRLQVAPFRTRRRTWLMLATACAVAAVALAATLIASGGANQAAPPALRRSASQHATAEKSPTGLPAEAGACVLSQMHSTVSDARYTKSGDGASILVVLTDSGDHACRLSGYSTAVAADAAGNLAAPATPVPRTLWGGLPAGVLHAPSVDLAGGDEASLIISWSAAAYSEGSTCVAADHVVLSSSDAHPPLKVSISTYLHVPWRPCDHQVTPFVRGATGSG
jgi:hypothetical protein